MIIQENIQISDPEFAFLRQYLDRSLGIHLSTEKKALVNGRLRGTLVRHGVSNFTEYFQKIFGDGTGVEIQNMVDRLTTNHSYFYRESAHFTAICSRLFPELLRTHREIRIWSAGCAAGEEPYTIAMLLAKHFPEPVRNGRVSILGSDISKSALHKARMAIYAEAQFSSLPEEYRRMYFRKRGDEFEVVPEIKEMVTLRKLNLIRQHFPFRKKFHIVLFRNVMIYFRPETTRLLTERLFDLIAPGGYLIAGKAENPALISDQFVHQGGSIYKRPGANQ